MSLSAKEAADLVGITRQGIIKAIKTGKISATKNVNGEWTIEPVELFRVYPAIDNVVDTSSNQDTASLQVKLEQLEQRLVDKDNVIEDLRRRLDRESSERERLTLILTETQQPRRSWLARLLGQ